MLVLAILAAAAAGGSAGRREGVPDSGVAALSSLADLIESSTPKPLDLLHKNVKTYILAKRVPVPYAFQFPVKIPFRRPYTVFVPKPYFVEVPKPVPFAVKVPVPHPYHVDKHIPFPYKVPIDKPIPVQVAKPYPVFVEKKVPIPVEKPVPVQIKIPVERPVPIHVPAEKPVLVPVKVATERPATVPEEKPESITTYEVKLKEDETEAFAAETQDLSPGLKAGGDFTPSPYDALSSSLISQGKAQKVISFLPSGAANGWQAQEPFNVSQQISTWSPINSTNDWVPRYVTAVQNKLYQDPFKFVPTLQHNSITEAKLTPIELSPSTNHHNSNHNYQQTIKTEIQPTSQSQVFTFVTSSEKPSALKFQESDFGQKLLGDGNYQFFNVHPNHGSKAESQITGVSFQRYESEVKPSEVASKSSWVQLQPQELNQITFHQQDHQTAQQNTFQLHDQQSSQQNNFQFQEQQANNFQQQEQQTNNFQQQEHQANTFQQQEQQANSFLSLEQPSTYQQEQHFGQQIKKEDIVLSQATNVHNQLPQGFDPHNYHQYKVYYQGPNQDHFQKNQQPQYFQHQDTAHQDISQTQFNNQNFHQLQSYHEQQAASTQPEQRPEGTTAASQYLRQTVVRRRHQRQTTPQPTGAANVTTTTTEPAQRQRKTRRRTRKRPANSTELPITTTPAP